MLDLVDGLVRRSLVVADVAGGETRYRMLETIRQYAAEQLEARRDSVEANRAHLEWCTTLMREAGREMRGAGDVEAMARVMREVDNIGSAVRYAIATNDLDAVRVLLGSAPAGILWGGPLGSAIASVATSVAPALGEPDHPATAAVLSLRSLDAVLRFAGDEAVEMAERACAIARSHGDSLTTAPWLALLLASIVADRLDIVVAAAREALDIAEKEQDDFAIAEWRSELGIGLCMTGDADAGLASTRHGLELAHAIGATNLLMRNEFLRGTALLFSGDVSAAMPHLELASQLGARVGFNILFGGAAWSMLLSIRPTDDMASAAAELREQLVMMAAFDQRGGIRFWSTMTAALLVHAGDTETAAVLMGAGRMLRVAGPTVNMLWDEATSRARASLGDARFDELVERGRTMALDDVTALALRSLDDVAHGVAPAPP
jgi:hypothetical protein